MEIPFCYLLLFPCCFSFFFLFIFSLINMCVSLCGAHMQCVSPWIYPLWDSLCFLDLIDYQLLMWVQCLGQEDSIEAGIATHSSILAWRTPWTEQPGGLWSMGSQRVGDNCGNLVHMHAPVCLFLTFMSRMMKLVIISKIMGESGKELILGGGKVPRFRVRTGMWVSAFWTSSRGWQWIREGIIMHSLASYRSYCEEQIIFHAKVFREVWCIVNIEGFILSKEQQRY